MKKTIAFLTVFLLPLSAQAIALSGSENTSVEASAPESGIHTDVRTTDNVEASTDGKDTPVPALLDTTVESDSHSASDNASTTKRTDVQHEDSSKVETENDLAKFNDSIVSLNENVASVDTQSSNEVDIEYEHPVKLFGIIPTHITSKTSASLAGDGTPVVETSFPWWKIFVWGIGDTTDKIDSAATAAAKAYLSTSTTAHAKAQLTEAIVATLNATAGAPLLGQ